MVVGASLGELCWTTNALPTNVTSLAFYPLSEVDACDQDPDGDGISTVDELFFYHTDPHGADTDRDGLPDGEELLVYESDPLDPYSIDGTNCDGLVAKLGGLDPFSCPEGSTNTVLEHLFYSGTTNGVFAYPESTVDTAVLEIRVSGEGSGRMVVGDVVVPLVAPPQMRSGTVTNTLLLEVGKGIRKSIWFSKPEGLDVAIDSRDLLIGREPSALFPRGWIAFPHTDATVPCIHDFGTCSKSVTLVHGEEFSGLTATWASESGNVDILNNPPIEAEISGHFPKTETRAISYTVDHPSRLNKEPLKVDQQLRFCPRLAEADELSHPYGTEDDGEPDYGECQCWLTGSCSCCGDGWCHCQCANCPCNQGVSPTLGPDDEQAKEAYTNIVGGAFEPMEDVLYLYGSNARSVHLDVPDGERPRCCDCPDHCHSNYVANVYCNRRIAVRNAAGEDFSISYQPCDVTVSGVSPSRTFADASVLFVTNGATYKRADYTVLGVRFESSDGRPDISEYNRRSQSFGYPAAICTNLNHASSIAFRTDVLLADGCVRVALEDDQGDIALWLPEWWDNNGIRHPAEPLLQSRGTRVRHMTIRQWRGLLGRYIDSRCLHVKVISTRPSCCMVKLEFVASNGTAYVYDHAEQRISTVMPTLFADYDWDLAADIKDALDQGNRRTSYFWTNNDTWSGDDAFAAYDEYNALLNPWPITLPSNGRDMIVNGRNDLVNLCPFAVDVSAFLDKWGVNGVRYVFYTGSPGNVRFVPVGAKWHSLDKLVKEEQKTIADDDLHSSALQVTSCDGAQEVGYVLPSELVTLGDSGAGLIVAEFATEGLHTLRVAVEDTENGGVLFESQVLVNALDVHKMYRWLNLDYACGEATDPKYNDRLGVEWPDTEHADANVVFVHGYNMHPSEAWDWSQAMFKRLRWSGMDAGFTAVLWRGNESQLWIMSEKCYATRNYHQNVLNAFRTASAFSSRVNSLPGAKKFMIAHSLGNMLVSAARQDYGLQYDKYFMLNAAVPIEAYDPVDGVTAISHHDMTPREWRPYEDRVRATHWYELFLSSPNDERSKLTWKGRFKDVDNAINFYSSRDEVVANGDDNVKKLLSREYAWYNQERKKGSLLVSFNPQAGWKFNDSYFKEEFLGYENDEPQYSQRRYTPGEAALIANTNLMFQPFFKDFRDAKVYGDGGSAFLQTNDMVRWYALSHGIPAESFATGANPVPKWGATVHGNLLKQKQSNTDVFGNINMAANCIPDNLDVEEMPWVHSYFIGNSLFDTRVLYEALVQMIGSAKTVNSQEGGDDQ